MVQELSETQLETYARQIVLKDIGYGGQLKLRKARACLIGLGGLGSLIAQKLVGMGIGYLRLADRDIVSRSDLHRQHLYDVDSIGEPKVEVALRKLSRLNPDVRLEPFPESLSTTSARHIIGGVDVVLDGLDSPEPRHLLNRTCHELGIPYVFGAAIEAFGNVSTILPGRTFCLECFMPGLRDEDLPKCGLVGVHPSILGVITAVQVSEAVRLLVGQEPHLLNRLLYVNLRDLRFDTIEFSRVDTCPVCGIHPRGAPEPLPERHLEETCARDGRRNFIITPRKRIAIDLERLRRVLEKKGLRIKTSGLLGTTFQQSPDVTASILTSGIMVVQTSPTLAGDPKADILETYKSILVDGLGFPPSILPEV